MFQGFNNNTKEYRINNIAAGGTINFLQGANSRFDVDSNGNVNMRLANYLNVVGDIYGSKNIFMPTGNCRKPLLWREDGSRPRTASGCFR